MPRHSPASPPPGPLSAASIRPARVEDAPLLADFLARLMAALGEGPLAAGAAPRLADHGFGADPRFEALIAEAAGPAAAQRSGYALFWPIYDTDTGGPVMYLSDLFVAEAWRGGGLALDLMAAVAAAGHGRRAIRGWSGKCWSAIPGRAPSIADWRRRATTRSWSIAPAMISAGSRPRGSRSRLASQI